MTAFRTGGLLALVLALPATGPLLAAPPPGYHARVSVSAPTRLDWTFALANRSLENPPPEWLGEYDSTQQQYELYVPRPADSKKPLPVILFVSPSNDPAGWKHFEALCKQRGFLFAGPRGAGNDCPSKKRVRIVLDVLDDVRRNFPTDPDRTYLAGFSGGARIACAVAFALPEHFGGVLPLCAAGDLREESWLRQRAIDRLSVACLTGEKDFNRGEVERLRGPLLKEVGVRARVWVQPGLGHAIPAERSLRDALQWLDDGATARRDFARRYPASRVAGSAAPSRAEAAAALLAEANKRLEKRATLYSGLMQMQGCMQRWPDLEAGAEARKVLLEYDGRSDRPWEADDIAEQRRFLIAQARALDAYASGELPTQYARMRPEIARQAAQLWQKVLADGPTTPLGQEARKRIPALEKLAQATDR
jgi:pimeloyl-ACP methyl ester carboxylesterase